jgi:hypothetical protein
MGRLLLSHEPLGHAHAHNLFGHLLLLTYVPNLAAVHLPIYLWCARRRYVLRLDYLCAFAAQLVQVQQEEASYRCDDMDERGVRGVYKGW